MATMEYAVSMKSGRMIPAHILEPIALILPVIGLVSGLALAPLLIVIAIPALVTLIQRGVLIDTFRGPAGLGIGAALLLPLITVGWAPDWEESLRVWLGLFALTFSGICVMGLSGLSGCSQPRAMEHALVLGMLLALIVAAIEALSGGFLVKGLLLLTGHTDFHLHDLNRGATILALLLWPTVLALFRLGRQAIGVLFPLLILGVLSILDSLAAVTAVALSSLAVLMVYLLPRWGMAILRWVLMGGILITPPVVHNLVDTQKLESSMSRLPDTAVHRLYIWEFASEKAMEQPLFGWGLHASRHIPGGNQEVLPGKKLLPLHPHDNILQVWLELGYVGVIVLALLIGFILRQIERYPMTAGERALCAGIVVSYMLIGMTAYGMWQSWWVASGWLVAGIMCYLVSGSSYVHMRHLRSKIPLS